MEKEIQTNQNLKSLKTTKTKNLSWIGCYFNTSDIGYPDIEENVFNEED